MVINFTLWQKMKIKIFIVCDSSLEELEESLFRVILFKEPRLTHHQQRLHRQKPEAISENQIWYCKLCVEVVEPNFMPGFLPISIAPNPSPTFLMLVQLLHKNIRCLNIVIVCSWPLASYPEPNAYFNIKLSNLRLIRRTICSTMKGNLS